MKSIAIQIFLALGLVAPAVGAETVKIDLAKRFQSIDHFGASDAWSVQLLNDWSTAGRTAFADLLFDQAHGIALSQWRFSITAAHQPDRVPGPSRSSDSFETVPGRYDWTRHSAQQWMLAAAKARGVKSFVAFSYSGTPRMTANGQVNPDPGPLTTNLRPDAVGAYASYLADIIEHFARGVPEAERIDFQWISPLNEPQWKWDRANQEATRASNSDLKLVYRAVDTELRRRRLPTHVLGVESGEIRDMYQPAAAMTAEFHSLYGDYLKQFCGNKEIAPLLNQVIGYHAYWSDDADRIIADREALHHAMAGFPRWQLWQTEYCRMEWHRDLGMDMALKVAHVMHADLGIAGASAWDWWLALSRGNYKDGLLYTDWQKRGDPETIIVPKTFWAIGHFSRFVRPGMVRVACDAPAGLLATSYLEVTSGKVVTVLINLSDHAQSVQMDIQHGASASRHQQAFLTDDQPDDNLRALAPSAMGDSLNVPARSLVTVVCD
ncbi:MAG: O-Glycosyl hydrolase [Phycisphaerales bacterium]|nr:O-Glycosyl hydrolase [Phycisphaerales bacterium]